MRFVKATAVTSAGKDSCGLYQNVLSYMAVCMTNNSDGRAHWAGRMYMILHMPLVSLAAR